MTPGDTILGQAARTALAAEIDYIRSARKPVFVIPAEDQVRRLIAAAWPVLTGAGEGDG